MLVRYRRFTHRHVLVVACLYRHYKPLHYFAVSLSLSFSFSFSFWPLYSLWFSAFDFKTLARSRNANKTYVSSFWLLDMDENSSRFLRFLYLAMRSSLDISFPVSHVSYCYSYDNIPLRRQWHETASQNCSKVLLRVGVLPRATLPHLNSILVRAILSTHRDFIWIIFIWAPQDRLRLLLSFHSCNLNRDYYSPLVILCTYLFL